jgi:hypothetical protein
MNGHLPAIQFQEKTAVYRLKDAKEMNKQCPPIPQLNVVHQIYDEHLEKIITQWGEPIGERILAICRE